MKKESGADAVKLQRGREGAHVIQAVANAGVPVLSHVGPLPYKMHQLGRFMMQRRTAEAALEIIADA